MSLPSGWVYCDGSIIPDPSIWRGMRTPNLNGEKRFLRGGSTSEVLRTEEDTIASHNHQYLDYYWEIDNGRCPGPGAQVVYERNVENNMGYADYFCKEPRTSYTTGNSETRPKNMKVIYIMKVF